MTRAWLGNWYQRVKERAQARGFESATAFAEAHPTTPLIALANQLGPDDVVASQLEKVLINEADETGTLERCARALLARAICEELPEGWHTEWEDTPGGPVIRRAMAFSAWSVALGKRCEPADIHIWNALIALPIPEGWLPDGPDDPYIVKAFEHWQDPE
jgi:hypothetical protein